MKTVFLAALTLLLPLLAGTPALAQARQEMMAECASVARSYFRDFGARTEMQFNGRRVDGTYAVNGRIFLETRAEDFACSFAEDRETMTEFFAEGRMRNRFLHGLDSDDDRRPDRPQRGDLFVVTGVAPNDVLNVRAGPSTRYRVIGALANGDKVRRLECHAEDRTRWCRIRMLDDMRSEGWVAARYLTRATTPPRPQPPVVSETGTVRIAFAPGATSASRVDRIAPGASIRYVLNARNRQFLTVELAGGALEYQIFNPDRTLLNGQTPARLPYRGQLWQSGDHVVEVINRTDRTQTASITIGID